MILMQPLPIDDYLSEITRTLGARGVLVLVAEPGAGKTTRVAPAIARSGILAADHPQIILLQPRRVAARAAAERIAAENGWRVGEKVGYHVRFEKRLASDTTIRVLTEGILTRQLVDDPFLERVGCIILDEFHERSLHTDVALALINEVRQTVRSDLKIVVMSATMDAGPVANFLSAPGVNVPGRTFPIAITYCPPAATGYRPLIEHASSTVLRQLADEPTGDVLVFLPGGEEIRRVESHLRDAEVAGRFAAVVVPLYGAMTLEEQQRAILPDSAGRRKIILATNIAETSLTIEGVTTVIDAGLARIASYDADRGLDRLELKRISQASATQRAGRAGRVGPGQAVRLWSEREHKHLRAFEGAEIKRVDLAQTVLMLHAWGKSDPRGFGWFEAPEEATLAAAEALLAMLGAVASDPSAGGTLAITALGRRMLEIPAHPRIARLLIAAIDAGVARTGAALAALLSEKDILRREVGGGAPVPRTQSRSDMLVRLALLEDVERSHFAAYWKDRGVDVHAARQVARTRDEFVRLLGKRAGSERAVEESQLLQLILTACPDRVVRRRSGDPWSGVMVGGGGVTLGKESAVVRDEFYVALEARHDERGKSRQALVTIASGIDRTWLATRSEKAAEYDESRDRVVGVTRELYGDLVLAEERHGAVDDAAAAEVLAAVVRGRAAEIIAGDEGRSVCWRGSICCERSCRRRVFRNSTRPGWARCWPALRRANGALPR